MPRTICARGIHGACVDTLQQGLSRGGLYTGVVGGLYGGGTERAMQKYDEPALVTAGKIGFSTGLGVALAFDIHVQNGGVKAAALKPLAREQQDGALTSQRARRLRTAGLVAQSAKSEWRPDVLARKTTIATGEGTVHGERLVLENWGQGEYAM